MMWEEVPLGEVARQRKSFITIDDDANYKRCRVQTAARGVVLRDAVPGVEIKTKKQQVCRAGDFLVAEIDAKAGGYGLVPSSLEGAVVSSHYFLFEVDEAKLDREYLGWFARTTRFFDQVRAVGSTNYAAIRPGSVLKYTMPLPPLPEQKRIVARLNAAAKAIESRTEHAAAVEAEISAILAAAFARITSGATRSPMGEVAPLVRRPVTIDPDTSYPELGARSFGRGLFTKPDVIGSDVTWQSLYRIEAGDLVFSNIKAWEGAFAVATAEHAGKHGSHRYLTCVPDPERATAGYLWYYLQSEDGLRSISEASPGSADRNRTLATKRLAAIMVPVPSLAAQRWFDELQRKAQACRKAQADAATQLAALLPALMNEAFGGMA